MKTNHQSVSNHEKYFSTQIYSFLLYNWYILHTERRISLNEARANYLKVSLEEKKLKREETANYRAQKLQILKEIKKAFENQKQ